MTAKKRMMKTLKENIKMKMINMKVIKVKLPSILLCYFIFMMLLMTFVYATTTLTDTESFNGRVNTLLSDNSTKLGLLFPVMLLFVTMICFAIDFGTMGVGITSIATLILLYLFKIVYFNPVWLTSLIIIIVIMLVKINKL